MNQRIVLFIVCCLCLLSACQRKEIYDMKFDVKKTPILKTDEISKEEAKKIALDFVKAKEVNNLIVSKEQDEGREYYEVKFIYQDVSYDFDIDILNGAILNVEHEKNQPIQKEVINQNGMNKEEALQIAMQYSNVSEPSHIQIDFDQDDGVCYYEVKFEANLNEYYFKIDQMSKKIVEYEMENSD